MRALFETSPVALVLTEVEGGSVILANARAVSLFEMEPETARRSKITELFARPEELATVSDRARARGQVEGVEVELATSSGRRFFVAVCRAECRATDVLARYGGAGLEAFARGALSNAGTDVAAARRPRD